MPNRRLPDIDLKQPPARVLILLIVVADFAARSNMAVGYRNFWQGQFVVRLEMDNEIAIFDHNSA